MEEETKFKNTGTIQGVAGEIRSYGGKFSIGVKIEDKWINYQTDKREDVILAQTMFKEGSTIYYNANALLLTDFSVETNDDKEHKSPEPEALLKDNLMPGEKINIQGKEYITQKGLLRMGHDKGIKSFEVIEQHVSDDMKKCWCRVRLIMKDDTIFEALGSSTPDNTGKLTGTHPIEMSHTRAVNRCLRLAVNWGEVTADELKG